MNDQGWGTVGGGARDVTIYTDAYVVKGSIEAGQGSLARVFDGSNDDVVMLSDVTMDEYGSRTGAVRAEFAQVNVATILFAVAGTARAGEEVLAASAPDQVLVSIPPFRIIGRIEESGEGRLREAVQALRGRFIEIVDAVYSSELAAEARTPAARVAVNRAKAHVIAPHREIDPWAGLATGASAGAGGEAMVGGAGGAMDPWGAGSGSAAGGDPWGGDPKPAAPANDPWRDAPRGTQPSNPWGSPGGDPWGAGKPRRDDELIG